MVEFLWTQLLLVQKTQQRHNKRFSLIKYRTESDISLGLFRFETSLSPLKNLHSTNTDSEGACGLGRRDHIR